MKSKFDWGSFEELFEGKQPLKQSMKRDFSAQVNNYVQSMLNNESKSHNDRTKKNLLYQLYETNQDLVLNISVPEQISEDLSVNVGSNQIKINGLPDGKEKIIKLPAVNNLSCHAQYMNGILEIRYKKK